MTRGAHLVFSKTFFSFNPHGKEFKHPVLASGHYRRLQDGSELLTWLMLLNIELFRLNLRLFANRKCFANALAYFIIGPMTGYQKQRA